MQFKESPFVDPKIPRYKKFERKEIEQLIEDEFTPELMGASHAYNFFGMENKEGKETLTPEEIQDFCVFAKHASKRILNADSQKNHGILRKLKESNDGGLPGTISFSLLMHDLSHVVGTTATERYEINDNSITPPFFEFKAGYAVNNKEVLENELYGIFFDKVIVAGVPKNFTLQLLRKSVENEFEAEHFIDSYVRQCLEIITKENDAEMRKLMIKSGMVGSNIVVLKSEARKVFREIEMNPPEKLVEMLHYVWDNKDNKRVLADLFFKEVGPYIENLKKRKPRKIFELRQDTETEEDKESPEDEAATI